jgi:hypothetical protein
MCWGYAMLLCCVRQACNMIRSLQTMDSENSDALNRIKQERQDAESTRPSSSGSAAAGTDSFEGQ